MRKTIIALLFIGICGCFMETAAQNELLTKFQKTNAGKKAVWQGDWTRASRFYSADLTIEKATAKEINFKLLAFSGASTGEIEGTAKVRGNSAYFDDGEEEGCQILFTNDGQNIKIETGANCFKYGGVGVVFDGDFVKGKGKVPDSDFVNLEVFPNKSLDEKFKTLIGAKEYENFLDAFQLINDVEDIDKLNAKVFSGCVRGVCPFIAGIIMYDDKGNFWAALNESEPDKHILNYYTNSDKWREKVPLTIRTWWLADKNPTVDEVVINYKSKK